MYPMRAVAALVALLAGGIASPLPAAAAASGGGSPQATIPKFLTPMTAPDQPGREMIPPGPPISTVAASTAVAGLSSGQGRPRQSEIGAERVDLRSLHAKVFSTNVAGQFVERVYPGPVHYRDATGQWQEIGAQLIGQSDGSFRNAANAFDLRVSSAAGTLGVASVRLDADHAVGFALEGGGVRVVRSSATSVVQPASLAGVSMSWTSLATGLKADLLLDSAMTPTTYVFGLTLQGLTAKLDELGNIIYRDEAGRVRLVTPKGFMVDSAVDPHSGESARSDNVAYQLVETAGQLTVRVSIDPAWLRDPARRFPVRVDPGAQVFADNDDTYVMTPFNNDYSGDTELKVGTYDSGAHIARSFLHLPLDTTPVYGKIIDSATLFLRNVWSWSCSTRDVSIYRVTSSWTGSGSGGLRTWSSQPSYDPTPIDTETFAHGYSGCGEDWGLFNVAAWAQNWASGAVANHGLMVGTNESNNYYWKKFASKQDSRGFGVWPHVDITYSEPAPANHDPFGAVDLVGGEVGRVRVAGWILDEDAPPRGDGLGKTASDVHVYVDGQFATALNSGQLRSDVGAAFPGYGNYHGYDAYLNAAPGTHSVCLYAINIPAGNNPQLGCQNVVVGTPLPAISKTVSPLQPTYARGQVVTYSITVSNPNAVSTPVSSVTDQLPAGVVAKANSMMFNGADCDSTTAPTCALSGAGTATVGSFTLAVGQTRTISVQATAAGDERGCSTASNFAYAISAGQQVNSAPVAITICDSGLGLEQWWSYVARSAGPQATASVNVANGNLVFQQQDSTPVAGHGRLAFVVRRTYNSQDTNLVNLPGGWGNGWMLSVADTIDGTGGIGTGGVAVSGAETFRSPAALTLVDRDGTRHLFSPRALSPPLKVTTGLPGALASLAAPAVIPIPVAANTYLCVDQTYTAPPGVHLSLWRYVQVQSIAPNPNCSPTAGTTPVVAGYGAMRPDRVRTIYASTGEALSLRDANGNELRYLYEAAPGPGVVLGRLLTVYEPRACPDPNAAGNTCRALRFSYPTGERRVTDPAGRVTRYLLDGSNRLYQVINPDGSILNYTYGSACSGGANQLCTASDPNANTTRFTYADNGVGPKRVGTITDRRGTVTTLYAGAGQLLAGTSDLASTVEHRQRFIGIDASGRVGELREGSGPKGDPNASDFVQRDAVFAWDRSGAPCRQPDNTVDNDLCSVTRSGTGAPTEFTSHLYNPEGSVLADRQATGTATLATTFGAQAQYVQPDGSVAVAVDSVSGSGDVASTGRAGAPTALFVVTDRTQALTPRGNASGAGYVPFRTDYRLDNATSAAAGAPPGGTTCTTPAAPMANTGNICEIDAPSFDGGIHANTTTRFTYDAFGQRLSQLSPRAVVEGGAATTYTYYADSDLDLSGSVSAGGWLKAVTDPLAKFVVFAYDRAGNISRAWDRDATSRAGALMGAYPGSVTPPSGEYVETLYATGAAPLATPWRYVRSQRDQLGDLTSTTVDLNGNATTIRPPRGNQAGNATFDVTASYDPGDLVTRRTTASNKAIDAGTTWGYDAFGNATSETDSNSRVKTFGFDLVNHPTMTRFTRGPWPSDTTTVPTACSRSTVSDSPIPPDRVMCSTSTAYDAVDNITAKVDGDGQVSRNVYDGVHRRIRSFVPRGDAVLTSRNPDGSTTTDLRTDFVYDEDGHPTDVCRPRQFALADGNATTCPNPPAYGEHSVYDAAGRLTSVSTRRDATSLSQSWGYDADGNAIRLTDPNGHVSTAGFDLVDRRTAATVRRDAATTNTTTWSYSAAGDILAVTRPPGEDGTVRRSAYSYDAAHRAKDTVEGASSTDAATASWASSDGGANTRTRLVYDADGHVVTAFGPRAFEPYAGVPDPRTNPNPAFATRIDYDVDGRVNAQWVPRYDATMAANSSSTQSRDCPTGAPGYALDIGVCMTRFAYDRASNLAQIDLPTSPSSANRYIARNYTDDNLVESVETPSPVADGLRGLSVRYGRDGAGRPVLETDVLGHATATAYWKDGLVRSSTEQPSGALTHVSTFDYDADGNPIKATDPTLGAWRRSYTTDGLVATETDADGGITKYSYDNAGNVANVYSPAATWSIDHPAALEATNTAGVPTTMSYTFDNLLLSSTEPVSPNGVTTRTVTYDYDPGGRKKSQVTTMANPTAADDVTAGTGAQRFEYYANDRLLREVGRNGEAITTTWNATGALATSTDSTNATAAVTASYFLDGLPRTTNDGTATTNYSYDGNGQPVTVGFDRGPGVSNATTYTYNDAGTPATIASSATGPNPWRLAYDEAGRPIRETQPNGVAVRRVWNDDDTLALEEAAAGSSVLSTWSYTYDNAKRVKSQTQANAAGAAGATVPATGTYGYKYTAAGRLQEFTDQSSTRALTWDHNGNRLTYGPQTFTYRADNSIATAAAPATTTATFQYWLFGGVKSDGCVTNVYDGFDRVTGSSPAVTCAQEATSYRYDGLDRQRERSRTPVAAGPTLTTAISYGGLTNSVALEGQTAPPVTVLSTATPDGRPLAASGAGGPATTQYLSDDGSGNVTTITDPAASVACTARLDPFGNAEGAISAQDSTTAGQRTCNTGTTIASRFYRGQSHDPASGRYQMGSRTYDPTKASFLTPDSYRAGQSAQNLSVGVDPLLRNTYSYVNGDPVNLWDPSGHRACGWNPTTWGDCAGKVGHVAKQGGIDWRSGMHTVRVNTSGIRPGDVLYGLENAPRAMARAQMATGAARMNEYIDATGQIPQSNVEIFNVSGANPVYRALDKCTGGVTKRNNVSCASAVVETATVALAGAKVVGTVAKAVEAARATTAGLEVAETVAAEEGGTLAKFDPEFAVSQGEAAIKTPYGVAVQSPSAAAAALQSEAASGATLYRAGEFGIQETEAGQFWSPKNPLLTPGYAEGFGTPGNAIDWVMGGEVDGEFITREAPGFGSNPGGEPEVVTNPFGMRNLWFHMP